MPQYRAYCITADGTIVAGEDIAASTPYEALTAAVRTWTDHAAFSGAGYVEIWQGARLVASTRQAP